MDNKFQNSLDPTDWQAFSELAHAMLDDILDYQKNLRERPVWQPIPAKVRASFKQSLPREPGDLKSVHAQFMNEILPYAVGNAHPGFMGWVHGGGTPVGMLADMLAAGLNTNLGGRDQIPLEVERQVLSWMRELFHFPETASGLFVTGTSMANLIAVWVARTKALGLEVRQKGIAGFDQALCAYTSVAAHGCIAQAVDLAGIGVDALRRLPVDEAHRMDVKALEAAILEDKASGRMPFIIVASAGTVDVGAIDDLQAIARIARLHGIWFHVDGAYGALAMLSEPIADKLSGIELSDSIAFDFHKWGQVPYDAGFILMREAELHMQTFAQPLAYLRRESRGMASNSPWPCDFGPDLSRGFRALKAWFTIKVYGADRLGAVIFKTCQLAAYLAQRIEAEPRLELLAPVALNIVCFRYVCDDSDRVNENIVADIHESGIAAPSTTLLKGHLAIRCAIVNHRTNVCDIDALIDAVLLKGKAYD